MDKGFKFDRFYIVESLPEKDEKTGEILANALREQEGLCLKSDDIKYEFVKNKKEFFECLHNIETESENTYPIIHFEMHGCEDGVGTAQKGDFISWTEFVDCLRKINIKTKNNLFVTMAICFGAYMLKELSGMRECPLWGFVGSFKPLLVENLKICYNEFYKDFLKNLNVNSAVELIYKENAEWIEKNGHVLEKKLPTDLLKQHGYSFIFSEEIFKKISENILNENDQNIRFRYGIYKTLLNYHGENIDVDKAVEMYKDNRNKKIEEFANKFFMVNQIPENHMLVSKVLQNKID